MLVSYYIKYVTYRCPASYHLQQTFQQEKMGGTMMYLRSTPIRNQDLIMMDYALVL